MKRLFQILIIYWVLSTFSPNYNAMETKLRCEMFNGSVRQTCQFTIGINTTGLKFAACNNSASAPCDECSSNNNASICNQTSTMNSSNCCRIARKMKPIATQNLIPIAIQAACYAVVFLIGVTGNSLVLLTVTSKRMRSVRNLLIGNLAVADLITLLICLPLTVIGLFVSWPFGIFICRYVFPLTDVVVSVSIITLCVITMDRFRAIVYPFAKKMTLKVTLIVFVIIWLASYLMVALPVLHLMRVVPNRAGRLVCTVIWPSQLYQEAYRLVILIVLYIIPVTLVFFCFICIVKRIRENIRFTRETVRDSRSLARVRRRSRVVQMMFVIFLTFTICLLPIHLLLTLFVFYPPTKQWKPIGDVYHAALIILTANSAMNPIILYRLSSEFKRGFKEHCLCFMLLMRLRGRQDVGVSKPSKSFNNQQLTTCLHLQVGNNDVASSSSGVRSVQKKSLLDKNNHNNGMKVGNGEETEL